MKYKQQSHQNQYWQGCWKIKDKTEAKKHERQTWAEYPSTNTTQTAVCPTKAELKPLPYVAK